MDSTKYIGMDVHNETISIAVINAAGAHVSERLGHSSVGVTADIYSHALRGREQRAARRWNNWALGAAYGK